MTLTNDEKGFLKKLVKQELDAFVENKKTLLWENSPSFLKGEHEYKHFLENLLRKLE